MKAHIKNKKAPTIQKVYALKLLHKCILKKNKEFAKYVEKKIMARLQIFAEFNKDKNTLQELHTKGELIFSSSEPDKASAAAFLILLLDCLEKWALVFP